MLRILTAILFTLSLTVSGGLIWMGLKATSTGHGEESRTVASIPEGEHGAAAAAPAGEHGAAPAAEGGAAAAAPVNTLQFALDDLVLNIASTANGSVHSLGLKIEAELFEHRSHELLTKNHSQLKNAVIEMALTEPFESLRTLAGKLAFKEKLVAKFNEQLAFPAVRNLHFTSFYLR